MKTPSDRAPGPASTRSSLDDSILLVAGIPAIGKSTFCRYLADQHGFAHYDMECWPKGWPTPALHGIWNTSRAEFASELRRRHLHSALDWGFPPDLVGWIRELQVAGVELLWFTGDLAVARQLFARRGGQPISAFDSQVGAIAAAGFPEALGARVVNTLTRSGKLRSMKAVYVDVFREAA